MLRPKRLVVPPFGFYSPMGRAVTADPVARLGRGPGPVPGRLPDTGDVSPGRAPLLCVADGGDYAPGEPPRQRYRGGGGLRT